MSPAQLQLGRQLNCDLPVRAELLKQQVHDNKSTRNLLRQRQQKSEFYYNKHSGRPLRELYDNQTVMINHNKQMVPGTVVKKHPSPRSYIVETMGGTRLRRNRHHLKATRASFQPESVIDQSVPGQAENREPNQFVKRAELPDNQPVVPPVEIQPSADVQPELQPQSTRS